MSIYDRCSYLTYPRNPFTKITRIKFTHSSLAPDHKSICLEVRIALLEICISFYGCLYQQFYICQTVYDKSRIIFIFVHFGNFKFVSVEKEIRSFIRIKLGRGKLMYISCYLHSHPINLLTKIDQISNQN